TAPAPAPGKLRAWLRAALGPGAFAQTLLPADDVADAHALSFKAGPIVSTRGPTRAFVASPGEPRAFRDRALRVLGALPLDPPFDLASFWDAAPPHARRMVDIGPRSVE